MTVRALPGAVPAWKTAEDTRRITAVSVACAVLLIAIKAAAWRASGSVALLSSLADSVLDLVASLGTFFAVRYAAAPPDAEHRFGHGKAEAFAALVQAGLVFASAALIGRESVARLLDPRPIEHGGWAVATMIASMAVTLLLVRAQAAVLKRTGSVAVAGDRAHYMADLLSNAAVLVGIAAAAFLALPVADGLAGLFVAGWLIKGAVEVFREAADHLMDRELPDAARDRILTLSSAEPGVRRVHQLRTRASGPHVMIQMQVELDPALTLEAAHRIMVAMERRILAEFPAADILIHPDPAGLGEPHGGAFAQGDAYAPPAVR